MALVRDPVSGLYLNQQSGQVFQDPAGLQPSTDPSLNSQVTRNLQISNGLYSQLGQYGQQFQQAQTGQNQLGAYLTRVIQGGAPSVAQTQLQQGLGQIQSGLNSQASGASGNNAVLANYNAGQAYADASAKANQAAAEQRAQEIATATGQRGQLLGQQANENAGMFQNVLGGANQASSIANSGGQTQAQIDQQNRQMWLNFISNLTGAGAAAGVKLATA